MLTIKDARQEQMTEWLTTVLKGEYQLELASSDASFRRYFRITQGGNTFIVMDAPPDKEDASLFADLAIFFHQHDIHVPQIFARDNTTGFLLMTDFGDVNYLNALKPKSADKFYQTAINSLINIQICPPSAIHLPHYTGTLLQQEMELFSYWFLDKYLNIAAPDFISDIFACLIDNAKAQPQVIVHRDYHSRNLMHTVKDSPGIIDFQDAAIGPVSYDLVSLLRDCYIAWPESKLTEWIVYYCNQAEQKNILTDVSVATFTRWFDLMGLQRHLKVLGIFTRLNHRDNKPSYLNNLPRTLHYVRQISTRYPECAQLADFVNQHPKIAAIK